MVKLNRIYTRTGDKGSTGLGDGSRVAKDAPRVAAYGTVDELNSTLGLVRLHASGEHDPALARVQVALALPGLSATHPLREAAVVLADLIGGENGRLYWALLDTGLADGADLEGPFYVGPGCRVAAGARIGPDAVLVGDVEVGEGAQIEDSVLWSGAVVGPGARVQGALLGQAVRIGRNAAVAAGAVLGEGGHADQPERLVPGEPERRGRLALRELQRQHAHPDEVRTMDPFERLRDDRSHAEQL